MDIAGGLIGLFLTALMFPFLAVAIKIKSPGPVLFCQERVGKNGRIFKIYKFRSMYVDAEARKEELLRQNEMQGLMFKMKEDPRVIQGVGVFIRKTSLDEFPQFWNVLKGDMSLVGTRPPTVEEYRHYDMHHLVRMSIKPGLTGLWQVSGRNEITDFEEVVKLDTSYIEDWSLNLDIKILLKTIRVVLEGRGE
ncbi:MAG: sugar transferase, partial [Lachnospiraceae bacterium]|nr:sugar transferase [Lachnospiraceae bacterium]